MTDTNMFAIEDYHIQSIFGTVMAFLKPTPIARQYGVDPRTLKNWVKTGEELLSKDKELFRKIMKIYHEAIIETDQFIKDNQVELTEDFLEENGSKELSYKNKGFFTKFLNDKKIEMIEETCFRKENEEIDKAKFHHDSKRNKNIKNVIKFSRAYNRAVQTYSKFLLDNVKNGVAQPKNVNAAIKFLGFIEPEEFNEHNFKDKQVDNTRLCLVDELLQAKQLIDSQQKKIEQKEEYVDAEYENVQ